MIGADELGGSLMELSNSTTKSQAGVDRMMRELVIIEHAHL